MNACRDFRSRLASLLSGRASSASFGELAWHEHLLGCADCRALVETEQALEELLASLPQPQLPPELAQRLLARLEPARGDVALDLLLERGDAVAVPGALASRMLAKLDSARAAQRACTRASDSRVRFRVTSTRPSEVKPLMPIRVRSVWVALRSSASTASRCALSRMSIRSTTMIPPRLRSRSCRAMACAASRLVRNTVSSKLRPPTKLPVFTSMVVIASV